MADTNETIADIIVAMRNYSNDCNDGYHTDYGVVCTDMRNYADRIDRARMKMEIEKANLRKDKAKLRKALDEILEKIDKWRTDGTMEHWQYSQLFDIADAALAEPVRNCDVGTAEEQEVRFDGFCMAHKEIKEPGLKVCSDNCPFVKKGSCELAWAQMPYVEKEGGKK